ncbi:MAG: hypothetical protein JST33_16360 [Actinobacteria bacterium]|nr:hypothetical protein [Actinomycetota bacterium]
MCASYGLAAPYDDTAYRAFADAQLLEQLRTWAQGNAGTVLQPTGRLTKNLNPVIRSST